jgi:hypothetical protein
VDAAAVAAAVDQDEVPPVVSKPKSAPRHNKVPAAGPIVTRLPLDAGDMEATQKKAPRRNKA